MSCLMEKQMEGKDKHPSIILPPLHPSCLNRRLRWMRIDTNGQRNDSRYQSCLCFSSYTDRITDTREGGEREDRQTEWWCSLLHGILVLLVCIDVLTGLFALLAPLALLMFVPPVAVALLAVMSPPAATANEWRKMKWWGVRKGEGKRGSS